MNQVRDAREKIVQILEVLRSSGGLHVEADIVDASADSSPIAINLTGEDASLFVRENGELLKAVHQVTAAALDLNGAEHELLWFDVDHLRAKHQAHMQRLADTAIVQVQTTQQPYAFAPMPSCERHMMHRALAASGLRFVSQGEGAERCVVLYPSKDFHWEDDDAPHTASVVAHV